MLKSLNFVNLTYSYDNKSKIGNVMSTWKFLVTSVTLVTLAACGGGGGGGSGGNVVGASGATSSLSGTASVGAPMAGATITVTDVKGVTLTTTADSSGAYSFTNISTLSAPLIVSASGFVGGSPTTYSSIVPTIPSNSKIVANATPFTDAIAYQAAGQSPGNLLTNPAAMASISAETLKASSSNVTTALAPILNGLSSGSATGYDPNSTAFIADGTSPYDKIHDLLSVYPSSAVDSTSFAINISDKSGQAGTVTIQAGASNSSITPLPALPSAIANLALSKLIIRFNTFNQLLSTTSGLNSPAFAATFSDSFLDNGQNKAEFLSRVRNPSSDEYFLGLRFSNPVVNSCTTSGVCSVSFLISFPQEASTSEITIFFIYNATTGDWLAHGNQQPDIEDGFETFAQLSTGSNKFQVGINFGVRDGKKLYPYNTAKAEFKDKSGTIDSTIYMKQKPTTCPTTSNTYYGLPFANTNDPTSKVADALCNNWYSFSDETLLKKINSKIMQGGYTIVVTAYTDNNWSTGAVIKTVQVTSPLLTSDKINASMFPKVQAKTDSTGPYLSITNASDFSLVGSVCLSSASLSVSGYCNMTTPLNPYTSVYQLRGEPPLLSVYRPIAADKWPTGQTIKTFFVNAKDKYGRILRVNN